MISESAVPAAAGRRFKRIDVMWRWDGENGKHILVGVPSTRSIHLFNPVGAAIFSLCDGSSSTEQIVEHVTITFRGAREADVGNDVISFLTYLTNLELIHEL